MFSKTAISVLEKRYLLKNKKGKPIEKVKDLFLRVAKNIALAEKNYNKKITDKEITKIENEFFELMYNLEFMPNSPTLMNAGRELQQLSACFVLPVDDSMESIFNAVKYTALIHKSGGGTGFSFSRLRSKNDIVASTQGVSSGPVSFMKVFNTATETVKQGGTRRGANMGILRVDHPDILEFIHCKDDMVSLTNFNLSIAITDKFMEALKNDEEYDLINPSTNEKVKSLKASIVFDQISKNAWKNGDPGIIFIDAINRKNPLKKVGEIESTNPCGEQPLLPYESCNLGSINLNSVVEKNEINYSKLLRIIKTSVRFLDNVIDMNNYPIQQISETTRSNRKIGLGIMGFADVLISLGIPYNSQEAVDKAEEIMKFVQETAHKCSSDLAVERGNFPNYNKSFYKDKEIPMRNATVTTIAPTGTISLICGASSGIEPIFALCYTRNIMDNQKFYEVYSLFEKIAKKENIYSQKFLDELVQKGSLAHFEEVSENIKKVFVTAHDIQPEWHIKIQAAFQKYTDNAVSKTINFKKDTTVEEIKETYLKAYEFGCKGITIYRDGSRTGQVLTVGDNSTEKENNEEVKVQVKKIIPKRRPDILTGKTVKMLTGCGLMYITLNEDENGNLFEIFSHLGKAGGCASSQSQAIGRLASLCLRTGVNPDEIVKQLIGISCHLRSGFGENAVYSCSDAVAKAIALHQNNKNKKYKTKSEIFHSYDLKKDGTSLRSSSTENGSGSCPDCGGIMEHEGGCSVCKVCGFSRCG